MGLFESVKTLIGESPKKKSSLFDKVETLTAGVPEIVPQGNPAIEQMKVQAAQDHQRIVADQFDQMAQETIKIPPAQRNTALNSPVVDTLTGGMSLVEADANAQAQLANYANLPKAMMGAGGFVKDQMGNDVSQVLNFLKNPINPAPTPVLPPNPQGTADLANVGGNALNFLFGPAIKGARAVGGLAVPEEGKTRLQSMIKDMVEDPGAGVYADRIGKQAFTGEESELERVAKILGVGAAGTAVELGTFMGPGKIAKAVKEAPIKGAAKDFEADFVKHATPEKIKERMIDLPGFKELTPEQQSIHVDDATKLLKSQMLQNPEIGDYYMGKQTFTKLLGDAEMSLREKLKMDVPLKPGERGSTEGAPGKPDVPRPKQEIKPPEPLDVVGNIKAAIPAAVPSVQPVPAEALAPEDLWDAPKKQEEFKLEPTNIHDKAEMELEIMSGDKLHPLERAMKSIGGVKFGDVEEGIPARFKGKKPADEAMQELANNHGIEFASDSDFQQALKFMGDKQSKFSLSDDVQVFLKNKANVESIGKKLEKKLGSGRVKKIVNSYTGVKKQKKEILIQTTEEQVLKHMLGVKEKASNVGFKAGQREARGRAVAELKNLFANQKESILRGNELQRIKDDIIARDKSGAKFETYKNRAEAKLDVTKREAELQRLQDDIVARDKIKVKKEIISYVKEKLPVEVRGKYLTEIGNAHSASNLSSAFRRVEEEVKNIERKDIVEKLKKESSKALESGKVAVEYKGLVQGIMDGIELKKRRPETLDRLRRTREHIEKHRAAGKDVEMPDRILNQLEILHRRSIDQLSVGELKSILANIQDLVKLGETKLKSRQAIYDMEKERITNDLLTGTMPLEKNPLIVAEVGEKLTPMQKFQNVFHKLNQGLQHIDLAVTPMDTFFDLMDGGHASFDGPNYRHYKVGMDTDFQTYLRNHNNNADEAIRLAHELKLDDQNFERIGVYAQTMQEGGRQKLLDRGMTEKQIDAISLTANEMKWYKMGRKLLEEIRPSIEETMKNVWNKPLGHVKNYWPMMTDYEKLTDAEIFERFGEGVPEVIHPTKKTPQGFTKERTGGTQPIKVNAMDVLLKHLDDAHYLINMSRRVKMLSEVANSKDIKGVSGDLGSVLTKEWLDLMARKGGIAGQSRIAILDILRRNFGLAQLGLNVSSALIQPTALLDGASIIGNYAFDGTYQIIANRDAREFVFENMPEVKARVGDDPAFIDFGDNKFITKMGQVGYAPIKFLDGITASGVAYGAYIKKLKELGVAVDLTKPNKEAIAYAQSIVRQTQSSGLYKDAPPLVSRGKLTGNKSFDKALAQFQTFVLGRWSTIRNRLWRANIKGGRESDPSKKDFKSAALIISMLTLAWAMEAGIRRTIRAGTDKVTGKVTKEKTTLTDDMLQSMLTTIPFVGQGVSMAVYKSDPIPSISGVRKVAEGVGALTKAAGDFIKGKEVKDKSKTVVDTLSGFGSVLGVPGTAQASKLVKSNIDSDVKANVVNLYEKAMRTENQKERDSLWDQADQLAVEKRILKEDAQGTAETRIRKEITDIYQQAIVNGDDPRILDRADKLGAVAKFDDDELDELYDNAQKRIEKAGEKAEKIEDQSRTYKPRPGLFDKAKELISSFK